MAEWQYKGDMRIFDWHPGLVAESSASYRGRDEDSKKKTQIPERLLAKLWEQRAARQAWFHTQGGRRVRVLYPGRPGKAAGPDFRDALLDMEGMGLVHGDVELHLRQRDWDAHGHGGDPNYNGVVLHGALEVDTEITTLPSGQTTPVVALGQLLAEEVPPASEPAPDLWALLEGHGFARPRSPDELGGTLDRAGDARFLDKSVLFQTLMREQSPQQTLYEGLMEGLGYRHNRQPFVKLAGLTPHDGLVEALRLTPRFRWEEGLESWLLHLSGLSPEEEHSLEPPPGAGFGRPMTAGEWHCFRVRPSNHPRRRIGGAARILARFMDSGLVEGIAAADSPRELTKALTVAGGAGKRMAYVGTGRAKDLAVNPALPFLHGYALSKGLSGSAQPYLDMYRKYGKLQDNEVLREIGSRLVGPAGRQVVTTARRQQGLLHLQRLLAGASSAAYPGGS